MKQRVDVRFDAVLLAMVDEAARVQGVTRTEFLKRCCREYFKTHGYVATEPGIPVSPDIVVKAS
jgi:metal-responsive CopG/Arc/MetJ family transcriptional regulator